MRLLSSRSGSFSGRDNQICANLDNVLNKSVEFNPNGSKMQFNVHFLWAALAYADELIGQMCQERMGRSYLISRGRTEGWVGVGDKQQLETLLLHCPPWGFCNERGGEEAEKMGLVKAMCEVETVQMTFRYWRIDFWRYSVHLNAPWGQNLWPVAANLTTGNTILRWGIYLQETRGLVS